MQIGVGGGSCGSAGDEYDQLRQFLPDPTLGPHDPDDRSRAGGASADQGQGLSRPSADGRAASPRGSPFCAL